MSECGLTSATGAVDPRVSTITAIQGAFEKAGVVFLDPGREGGPGLRLA